MENIQADLLNPISRQRKDMTNLTSPQKIAFAEKLHVLETSPSTKHMQRRSQSKVLACLKNIKYKSLVFHVEGRVCDSDEKWY